MSKLAKNNSDNPSAVIWLVDGNRFSDAEYAFFAQKLGSSETDRYRRFLRAERQRQFLVGRMLLRFAIGNLMTLPPATIAVKEQADGAPQLVLPDSCNAQPGFSLSHSGKWVACAVSGDSLLGLDIEIVNPERDLVGISRAIFQSNEIAWLERQPTESCIAAFYQLWSLREALFKLLSNANDSDRIPELLDAEHAIASHGKGWHSHVLSHAELSCVLCSTHALSLQTPLRPSEVSPAALLAAMRQGAAEFEAGV